MSSSLDNRIVKMTFDNAAFEKGVSQSRKSINDFDRNLENLGKTKAFSGLSDSIDKIAGRFSTLGIAFDQTIRNITNTAERWIGQLVSTINRGLSEVTFEQLGAGFEKFQDKTTSVATILAQGYDLDTVEEQLARLNWFTDETSYNFTDMVASISKFTATGQDLETSVNAMEGIANWAALSGQNASVASRAMYNIAQAMGAGTMRLIDYKSIQNASMDTKEFRERVLATATALDRATLKIVGYTDAGEELYETLNGHQFTRNQFTEYLEDNWFNSDVMMAVFEQYGSAVNDIYEYTEKNGGTAADAMKELDGQVDEFGLKAFKAAQAARTWKDAVDSVKDAASTAWMNIWENLFGNAEQATEFFTMVANEFYDVFVEPVNAIGEFVSKFNELGGREELVNVLTDSWGVFKEILSATIDVLGEFSGPFKAIFGDYFNDEATDGLSKWAEALKNYVSELGKQIKGTLKEWQEGEQAEKFKKTLRSILVTVQKISSLFGAIGKAVKRIFSAIAKGVGTGLGDSVENAGSTLEKVSENLFNLIDKFIEFLDSDEFEQFAQNVEYWVRRITSDLVSFAGGAFLKVRNLFESIVGGTFSFKDLFGQIPSDLASVLPNILTTVTDFLGLDAGDMPEKLGNFLSGLTTKFESFGSSVDSVWKNAKTLFGDLFNWEEILQKYEDNGKGLSGVVAVLTDTISKVVTGLIKMIEDATGWDLSGVLGTLEKLGSVLGPVIQGLAEFLQLLVSDAWKAFEKGYTDAGGGMKGALAGVLSAVESIITNIIKKVDELGKFDLATALGSIAGDSDAVKIALEGVDMALDGIVGSLKFIFGLLNREGKTEVNGLLPGMTDPEMVKDATENTQEVLGFWDILVGVLKRMVGLKTDEADEVKQQIDNVFNVLSAFAGGMAEIFMLYEGYRMVKAMSAPTATLHGLMDRLADIGAQISKILKETKNILRWQSIAKIIKSLAILMGTIAVAIIAMALAIKRIGFGEVMAAFILMSIILGTLISFVEYLASEKRLTTYIKGVSTILTSMSILMGTMVGSIIALAAAIMIIQSITNNWGETIAIVLGSFALIVGLLFAMVYIVRLLNGIDTSQVKSVTGLCIGLAVFFVALGFAMSKIASIPTEDFGKAITGLAIGFIGLAAIITLLENMHGYEGAALMLAIAAAIAAVAGSLWLLKDLSPEQLFTTAGAIVGLVLAMTLLGVGIAALLPVMPGLAAAGGILLMFAGAVALIGVGMLSVAAAFELFIDVLAKLANMNLEDLQNGFKNLHHVIIMFFDSLMVAINKFFQVLNEGLVMGLWETIKTLGTILIEGIAWLFTELTRVMSEMGTANWHTFVENFNKQMDDLVILLEHLIEVIVALIAGGIGAMISGIIEGITAAIDMIADAVPRLAAALTKMADALDEHGDEIKQAVARIWKHITEPFDKAGEKFMDIGKNIMEGLGKGINALITKPVQIIGGAISSLVNGVKERLETHSPSRVFADIGKNVMLGLTEGIDDNAELASEATVDVADDMIHNMRNAVAGINDLVETDSDPVIRPVLDLSEIQNGVGRMNGMFGARSISANATYAGELADHVNSDFENRSALGGVSINMTVNGVEGQDVNALADEVIYKLNNQLLRRKVVFG